jgi:hypothetical protein
VNTHRRFIVPTNTIDRCQYYHQRAFLQSPMPALSGQNRPRRSFGYACGDFVPAALASNFSLGLITILLLG